LRCDFIIQKFEPIINNVITHFDNYPLENVKQLDYNDFREAVIEYKKYFKKRNSSSFDINKIKILKAGINTGRDPLK